MERRHNGPHSGPPHGHRGHGPGPGPHSNLSRPPFPPFMPPPPPPPIIPMQPLPFGIRLLRPLPRRDLERAIRILTDGMHGKRSRPEDALFLGTVFSRPIMPHEARQLVTVLMHM